MKHLTFLHYPQTPIMINQNCTRMILFNAIDAQCKNNLALPLLPNHNSTKAHKKEKGENAITYLHCHNQGSKPYL